MPISSVRTSSLTFSSPSIMRPPAKRMFKLADQLAIAASAARVQTQASTGCRQGGDAVQRAGVQKVVTETLCQRRGQGSLARRGGAIDADHRNIAQIGVWTTENSVSKYSGKVLATHFGSLIRSGGLNAASDRHIAMRWSS